MSLPRLSVFVSATSSDLGECRRVVRDVLLAQSILPVVQEHFPPDYRSLIQSLQSHVAACDAVICLVGDVFGAAPANAGQPLRSYTQLEYDVARQLDLPVFVFLTAEAFRRTSEAEESQELVTLQRRHREALLEAHKCEYFASAEDLRNKVFSCVPQLMSLGGHRRMFCLHQPTRPLFFAGRRTELMQLTNAMPSRDPVVIAVLGAGGQGKTTLVRQAVFEELQEFPFAAGFWCTAYRGGFSFDEFLDATLSYLLGGKYDKRQTPEISQRSDQVIGLWQQRPVLLVIDGVERWLKGWNSAGHISERAATIEQRQGHNPALDDFLAAVAGLNSGTHVILTSRAMPAALDHLACAVVPVREPGRQMALEGLDDEAACALLRQLGVRGSDEQLKCAARTYANHPLALEVIAGLLANEEGGRVEHA